MFTENANRAVSGDAITPDNFQPNPKNPIIAAFFRNIGLADELGSGVRRLYRYVPRYSGKPPIMIDGDVFSVIIPLDDEYSFDAEMFIAQNKTQLKDHVGKDVGISVGKDVGINETQLKIVAFIAENTHTTIPQIAEYIGITERRIESNIRTLKSLGIIEREGGRKHGRWIVKTSDHYQG